MIYVLIIKLTIFGYASHNTSILFQEFSSKKNCEYAEKLLSGDNIETECVKK